MTLKLHHLRPAPGAKTAKTRVGRGEASKGKTAGRGTKGTKARYQVPAAFEGGQMPIHMRLPKLKGFKNPFKVEFQVVNLDRLGDLFPEAAAQRAEEFGVPASGTAQDVLDHPGVEIVINLTIPTAHAEVSRSIVAAGISGTGSSPKMRQNSGVPPTMLRSMSIANRPTPIRLAMTSPGRRLPRWATWSTAVATRERDRCSDWFTMVG